MGRNPRSVAIPRGFARYLQQWWVNAEAAGSGRQGRDILGTPGVAWEVKTGGELSPAAAVAQAQRHTWTDKASTVPGTDLPVVAYFPPGVGERGPWIAMLPGDRLMKLLTEAGYVP